MYNSNIKLFQTAFKVYQNDMKNQKNTFNNKYYKNFTSSNSSDITRLSRN